jgi:Outer membrane protein beta-barrel family/CarboxypepD_reg-like domain
MMRIGLLVLTLLYTVVYSYGQASIKGKITDRRQGLPFATVLLLGTDSALVKGMITDQAGEFVFERVAAGKYFITSSAIGYTKSLLLPVEVNTTDITLPDITLEESATELSEVVVKAEKPLFEQQIDRLVMNVQNSITSSGNTILELLQKSPGIVVNKQNNSISMNGKAGVKVMINNKMMQLPLDMVMQLLDGMNSSNVAKIELITTPPSKYDAEGTAGIIHIVMKENADMGTSGSIGLTLGAHWAETFGGNVSVHHRSEKVAYFMDYAVMRNHNKHRMRMDRESMYNGFAQRVDGYSNRTNITTQHNLNAGFEWKLSPNTLLNVGVTGYRSNWEMLDAVAHDVNQVAADSTVITQLRINESNIWQSVTGAVGLQSRLNDKSELALSLDYLYYHNSNPSDYNNRLFYEQHNTDEISIIDLQKTTPISFLVGRVDYTYHWSPSFTLETGAKAVSSHLDNNVLVQRWVNDTWVTDPVFTSYSTLNEQVGAAYVSTQWQPAKKWQINSGLRYEYTHTTISTPTEKNLVNRKYGYLFPTFNVRRDIDTEKDFQFSYTRRITRPTYNDIAPFVFFWGPASFSSGNTSLWPAVSDAIRAGYHVRQWIFSVQFSHSQREINSWQPEVDSQSNLIYRSQNLKYLNTLGVTNSYSFRIAPWWEVQSNLTAHYQAARTSHLQDNTTLNLYVVNANVVNAIRLPKDFAIEVSGMYQSRSLFGIAEYLPMSSLNAGIQKKVGDKGTWRLAIDDVFNSNYWRIKTSLPENNLNSYFSYNFHNRFVRLTYQRNIGNRELRSVKLKSGSQEERKRVAN